MKPEKKALDLGCGNVPWNGTGLLEFDGKIIHADLENVPAADVVFDAGKKFPFPDNEFDVVYCSHTLEMVGDFRNAVEEIYRVLKPGGIFFCVATHYSSPKYWSDPFHRRAFASDSFRFTYPDSKPGKAGGNPQKGVNELSHYSGARFELLDLDFSMRLGSLLKWIVKPFFGFYEYWLSTKLFPVWNLRLKFRAVK